MDSMETVGNTVMDSSQSPQSPHGVPMESSQSPQGVLMDSVRTVRSPHGVHGNPWVSVKYSESAPFTISLLSNLLVAPSSGRRQKGR
jgi:hypothetical protein